MATDWKLGTMGFGYKQWVGSFYPAGMSASRFLTHYSQQFDAVEIDSTFYGTPRPAQIAKWYQTVPAHFTYCLKTPRQITHDLRLLDGVEQMMHFLDVVSGLKEKLGSVLIQLGPDFTVEEQPRLVQFIEQLPSDFRFAVEFRHRSWVREETAVLLNTHNICWVAADYIHLPKTVTITADFLYLRFIGPHGQYATKDQELADKTADLRNWHDQIKPHLPQLETVYGFFNNDYSGHSPTTANRFRRIVGLPEREIRPLQQGRLF